MDIKAAIGEAEAYVDHSEKEAKPLPPEDLGKFVLNSIDTLAKKHIAPIARSAAEQLPAITRSKADPWFGIMQHGMDMAVILAADGQKPPFRDTIPMPGRSVPIDTLLLPLEGGFVNIRTHADDTHDSLLMKIASYRRPTTAQRQLYTQFRQQHDMAPLTPDAPLFIPQATTAYETWTGQGMHSLLCSASRGYGQNAYTKMILQNSENASTETMRTIHADVADLTRSALAALYEQA